ncbi:hypothetical protein ACS04_28530 [Streptomyces roseus]|uniref:Uncharacterized protein n=1 Tax=Streptomyces roseus TaxID=66430 RepID=A0A0J6XIU7_9ACTN|nr:hypothetical protein ACS04_28530 [Streptomyces roseus]
MEGFAQPGDIKRCAIFRAWFQRAGSLLLLPSWLAPAVVAGPSTLRLGKVARSGHGVQLPVGAGSAQVSRLLSPGGGDDPLPLAVVWSSRTAGERHAAARQQAARQVTAISSDSASYCSPHRIAGPLRSSSPQARQTCPRS